MSKSQMYAVATMLATNKLWQVLGRLKTKESQDFARSIDRFYTRRSGFIPQPVLDLIKLSAPPVG